MKLYSSRDNVDIIREAGGVWVHAYALAGRVQPKLSAWPVQESYVDIFVWPGCNEYTIHQCLGPVAYTWGYLAATRL